MFFCEKETDGCYLLGSVNGGIVARVNPADGMNIHSLEFTGKQLVVADSKRKASGGTYGIPVLYPSPNRIRGGSFVFDGKTYPMAMHGMARNLAFTITGCYATAEQTALVGKLDFSPGSAAYQLYPIRSTLELTVLLTNSGLRVCYRLCNLGSIPLPYGFGLHSFFSRLQGAIVRCSATTVMAMDQDKYPTGQLMPVEGTMFDLRGGRAVANLALDHVYYDSGASVHGEIRWERDGLALTLETSDEFHHMVVYTPAGANFVCMENQSCSTDCHNLYNLGFTKASGLQIVPPGQVHSGFVFMATKRL